MKEEDILNFMRQDWVVTGSDGAPGHPRKFASFTRKLASYARDQEAISLGHAINSSSSRTALILGIKERGLIKPGYFADIAVFKLDQLMENADYENPYELSEGMGLRSKIIISGVGADLTWTLKFLIG